MDLFVQFIQERVYLKGGSPKTVIAYGCAFKAFAGATEAKTAMTERIAELGAARLVAFKAKGLNPGMDTYPNF